MRSKRTEREWWILMKCPVQDYCRARWHPAHCDKHPLFFAPIYEDITNLVLILPTPVLKYLQWKVVSVSVSSPLTADMFFFSSPFLMGLGQTLQGAALSQQPSLKRPQQITAQGREEWGTGGGAIRELQSVKDKRAGVFKRTTPSPVTAQHRVHQSRQLSL